MGNTEKIKLLKEVREIIDELGGIDETTLQIIGVNVTELEDPIEETLRRLKAYQASINKEDIERLDYNIGGL